MPNTPAVSLRIPVEQKAALDALSEKSGISVSQLIIACITRALPYIEGRIDERLATSPQPSDQSDRSAQ